MAVEPLYPLFTQSPYLTDTSEGKVLIAQRLFVAAINTAAPGARTAGVAPTGWTDLGSIEGSAATLTKEDPTITDVTTGLFEVLRAQVPIKDGNTTCTVQLAEYEPASWHSLTGDAITTIGADGSGSIYVGGRPLIQQAVLLVGQNAATGSEFHHWSPKANLAPKPADVNKFQEIELKITFLKFTPGSTADPTGLLRDYQLFYFKSA